MSPLLVNSSIFWFMRVRERPALRAASLTEREVTRTSM